MSIKRTVVLLAAAWVAICAGHASAQATRTWVSGVGDDVNPCSRTAPCKTFAGAISKTVAGGEISVLDPGGYGAVTITKSITIDGGTGAGWASIINTSVAGVIVNAAGITVTLRNISINGAGSGMRGVRIIQASKVFIENCEIFGNAGADPFGRGISDERTTGGQLFVTDTVVRNNSQSGIVILPATGSTPIDVTLRGVKLLANGNSGLVATQGAVVTMSNSAASGNANFGVYVEQLAGTTRVFLSDSSLTDNATGLHMDAGPAQVRISNMLITNNDNGVNNVGGATLFSYGNNRISGNTSGNNPAVAPIGPI